MREALIVGGGPAGCAASILLARWGHRVTLITRPITATAPLGESIPPSTRKLFDVLGVRERIDGANFVPATGNTVWWGTSAARVEQFANGQQGWHVTTDRLAALLRQAATDAGVTVDEARVDTDVAVARPATFVLDCSGRAGVFARAKRLRAHESQLRTIAMVGVWRADRFAAAEPTHTWIESYEGGWIWSVPRSLSERFVAVMIDPRSSDLAREKSSPEVYLAEISKATHVGGLLGGAALVDGPRGWDASMYHATRYVDEQVLLVGDAGSFIDPLSSAGIKKALASGWLAAVATHTAIVKPSMRDVALEFFAAREQEVYASFRAMTQSVLSSAASGHTHPFWTDRADEPPLAGASADVAAAFERIRAAPDLRVARSLDGRVEPRPAVSGAEIILERRLVSDERPEGVRYVADVDLLALVELAPAYTSVPDAFDAYNRQLAPVALPDFLAALATAIAQKWLVWCDTY
jgi:flavin-dependent dehydrogenase